MTTKNDGGSAFPSGSFAIGDGDHQAMAPGMTLRDWFAGQALAMMDRNVAQAISGPVRAKVAYEIADAMLEARK